jgi:hypothetical protein
MKYLARIAALAGLAVAVWLVWHADARAVLGLMRAAGAGLALAGMAHVLPMLANARNWQMLMRGAKRPNLFAVLRLVWIRESVNGMHRDRARAMARALFSRGKSKFPAGNGTRIAHRSTE